MINISGSVKRSYIFPASPEIAFEFYADLERTFRFIPHITLKEKGEQGHYRMLYDTVELGVYRVKIYCDLETNLDRDQMALYIQPTENVRIVKNKIGMYSLTAQGEYSSKSLFLPHQDQTEIEYQFRLHAELPLPFGARFMPKKLLNDISESITTLRMQEIADGFIQTSLRAFDELQDLDQGR